MQFLAYAIGGLIVGGFLGLSLTAASYKKKEKTKRLEIQQANKKILGITQEIRILKGEKEEPDRGLAGLMAVLDQIKEKFDEAKKTLEKKEEEIRELRSKKEEEIKELRSEKEEEIKELRSEIQEQEELIKEANDAMRIKGERIENLQEERDQLKVTVDSKERENAVLKEENAAIKEENKEIKAKNDELKTQNISLREEGENKTKNISEITEKMESLKETRENLESQIKATVAELEKTKELVQQQQGELQKNREALQEKEQRLIRVESEYQQNISLRSRAVYELKRTLDMLESIPIPKEFEYKEEEVEFSLEETGIEELTVQLAEQEKKIKEKEAKIAEMSHTLLLSDQQDAIIQELTQDLKKNEKQLEEVGKNRAALIEEIEKQKEELQEKAQLIAGKEEMIQKYVQKIQDLEDQMSKQAAPRPVEAIDTKKAILSDPNLTKGQQTAMLLLYSQYQPKRDEAGQPLESRKEDSGEEESADS